jgi:hypothetical protein
VPREAAAIERVARFLNWSCHVQASSGSTGLRLAPMCGS